MVIITNLNWLQPIKLVILTSLFLQCTDIEGIKLDQVVNERHILDKFSRIKEIGEVLTKLEKPNDEIRQQIYNMNEISEPLLNRLQQTMRFEYSTV